ncbi:L,D-transpeptidase [Oricola sp.]|uniref:L,D-transpeptidase family protein n=1 Tax=Oricola sp. TaxID=1979950 RepID=UPI003518484F
MRPAPGDPRRGILVAGGRSVRCALGRGGMHMPKREGDGATPVAAMRIVAGWFRADRMTRPLTSLDLEPIGPRDGWCDAPADPNYNRPVRLPYAGSHEKMLRDDRLYDVCLVLDWNLERGQAKWKPVRRPAPRPTKKTSPFGRQRYRGSAIFLHIARPGFPPTEGCIAVAPETMRWLLPRIGPQTVVRTLF